MSSNPQDFKNSLTRAFYRLEFIKDQPGYYGKGRRIFTKLFDEWFLYLSMLKPTTTPKDLNLLSIALLRSTFQGFKQCFELFKDCFDVHNDEDNILVTLTTLRRMNGMRQSKAKELNASQDESRLITVNFSQYDWLFVAYLRTVGGEYNPSKLEYFLRKVRITCSDSAKEYMEQDDFPRDSEFCTLILDYLVSLQKTLINLKVIKKSSILKIENFL